MSDPDDLVDALVATVDYLRITVGGSDTTGWVSCADLVSDPHELSALVATTKPGVGTDRDDVAVSLFVQGYAFRVASAAIGAWILADAVLSVAPAATQVSMSPTRPNGIRLERARLVRCADPLAGLHDGLVEGHLAPLVDSAHRSTSVGAALLWGDVGSACASSFGAFAEALPSRREEVARRADAFFATARPELRRSGRMTPVGVGWEWERASCCLWYLADGGFRCADCSLWTDAERAARRAGS